MAYIDPTTGQEVLTPEEELERKRKAAEEAAKKAGTTPVATTETTVYEDGSKTRTVTQEEPAPSFFGKLGTAVQQAGTNFVNNVAAAPENFARNVQAIPGQVDARVMNMAKSMAPQPQAQAQPVAQPAPPAFDQAAYNASIAQQESGGRQDIGYHDRSKSTAFGPTGLTTAAYQDARKLDPSLPADITQANPAQLNAAQTAFTQQNAQYLQGYGIQPTANTLAAAHFIGAKGLSDFQTRRDEQGRPYISPQAQQANGGYEKTAAIINQRLGGQAAPASGAVRQLPVTPVQPSAFQGQTNEFGGMEEQPIRQPAIPGVNYGLGGTGGNQGIRIPGLTPVNQMPAAQPDPTRQFIDTYQAVQNDTNGLMKLALDENAPAYLRERSREQFATVYDQQKKEAEAQKKLPDMSPKEVSDAIQGKNKSGIGDWLQYLLFRHVGLNDLANQKGEQLGIGHTWQNATVTDENGVERGVEVLTSASGRVLRGNYSGSDTPISREQLEQAASGVLGKGVHLNKTENRINPLTNEVVSVQTLSNGQQRFKLGGKNYTGDKAILVPEAQFTKQEDTRVNAGYTNLSRLTANPTPQQKVDALRNAGVSVTRIEQEIGAAPGSLSGKPAAAAAATGGAATGATTQTPAVQSAKEEPVQRPGESNELFKRRISNWENKTKLQQKEAEAFANTAVETRAQLQQIQNAVDVVKGGNYFMGPLFSTTGSKILPGAQEFFASKFGDQTSTDNTRMLRSLITREGLQGIKNSMGPSISNFDVQAWLKSNPVTEQSSPQALQNYFTKLHNTLYELSEQKRKIAVEQGMLEPSFNFGNKIEAGGTVSDDRRRADEIIKKK